MELDGRSYAIDWLENRDPTPSELEDIERQVRKTYGLPQSPRLEITSPGPAPAPKPRPWDGRIPQDLVQHVQRAGFRGERAATAIAVAMAESGGNPRAHNPNAGTGDNSYGLWQINMLGGMGPERRKQYGLSANEALFDPQTNARVAYQMSGGGQNWRAWTTYTSGKYKQYLGAARKAIGAVQQPAQQPAVQGRMHGPWQPGKGPNASAAGQQSKPVGPFGAPTIFEQLTRPQQKAGPDPFWESLKPLPLPTVQVETLQSAMAKIDRQLAGRMNADQRAVVQRFLKAVGGEHNITHEQIQVALRAAGAGKYRALTDPAHTASLLPFNPADLLIARRQGAKTVPSKEGGQLTLRVANRIAARYLALPVGKLTDKDLAQLAKAAPLPGIPDTMNPMDRAYAEAVPDDALGIYLNALPAAFQLFPKVLQEAAGQLIGRPRGSTITDPDIQNDPIGQIGSAVFPIASYFTPAAPVKIGSDVLAVTQRSREVGPVRAGREFVQGMLQSANVLEPDLPIGERVGRGLNLLLMGLGATHGGVRAYRAGQKLGTVFELSSRLGVSKTEAWALLKSAEAEFARQLTALPDAPKVEPITSARLLAERFQDAFNLSREQAIAVASLADARAQVWSAKTGRPAEDWYSTHLADVVKGGQPAQDALLQPVPVDVARSIDMPVRMPTDERFLRAVNNTKGAELEADGLRLEVVRYNDPEQSGGTALRTGVFYLPVDASQVRYYRNGKIGYGGSERVQGTTLVKNPLVVEGATGGKAPEAAYDLLKGKDAYSRLRVDAAMVVGAKPWDKKGFDYAQVEKAREFLTKHGGDPDLADELVYHSQKGNTLMYALLEHVVAHEVRAAGYDSVLGLSRRKTGPAISELFDVRESVIPTANGYWDIHPEFRAKLKQPEVLYQHPTRTEAFKTWFGRSQVVDELGEPLVVYHGTPRPGFTEFAPSDRAVMGKGIYFTPKPEMASDYALGTIQKVFENPAIDPRPGVYPVYLRLENPAMYEDVIRMRQAVADQWTRQGKSVKDFGNIDDTVMAELRRRGHDGVVDQDWENIMVFDAQQVKSAVANKGKFDPQNPNILEQQNAALGEQGAKGSVEFLADGRAIIRALERPDISTAVHELGHVFRRDLEGQALAQVERWAGVKDSEWTTQAEEKFARAFERYLRTGKAPSSALKSVFEQFREWLTAIYQRIAGSPIDERLSPELRQAFDELLALPERPSGVTEKLLSEQHAQAVAHAAEGDWETTSPEQLKAALGQNRSADSLSQYSIEELGEMFLYKAKDAELYFALKPTREHEVTGNPALDVVAVVNNERGTPGVATPGVLLKAIDDWINLGGPQVADLTLDAWDVNGFLPKRYARFGFKEYQRFEYDLAYGEPAEGLLGAWKQEGWKEGEPLPSVVYMKYEGPTTLGEARRNYLRTGDIFGRGTGEPGTFAGAGVYGGHGVPVGGVRPGILQGEDGGPGLLSEHPVRDSGAYSKRDLDSFSQQYRDLQLFSDDELRAMGLDPAQVRKVEPLPEPGTQPLTPEERALLAAADEAPGQSVQKVGERLGYGDSNVLVTRERYEQAVKELREGLGKMSMGVDPTLLKQALEIAVFHAEAGVRTFGQFVQELTTELGQDVVQRLRDHLPDLWDRARARATNYRVGTPQQGVIFHSQELDALRSQYTTVSGKLRTAQQAADAPSTELYTERQHQVENKILEYLLVNSKSMNLARPDAIRKWVETIVQGHVRANPEPEELVRVLGNKFELDKQQAQDMRLAIEQRAELVEQMWSKARDLQIYREGSGGQVEFRPPTFEEFYDGLLEPVNPLLAELRQAAGPTASAELLGLERALRTRDERIQNLVFKSAPRAWLDGASSLYKSFMLLGIKGPINNFVSNMLNSLVLSTSRPLRGGADKLLSLMTGQRTRTAGWQSPTRGVGQAVNKDVGKAIRSALQGTEAEYTKYDVSRMARTNQRGKVGSAGQAVAEMGFRLASAGDKPFWELGYRRALEEMALIQGRAEGLRTSALSKRVVELVESPTDMMMVEAALQADYAVLANKNLLAEAVNKGKAELKKGEGLTKLGGAASEFILPFVKIPLNAAGRALEFSGLGLFEGMGRLGSYVFRRVRTERGVRDVPLKEILSKEFVGEAMQMMPPQVQRHIADNIGNGLTGMGLLTLGYAGYKAGIVRAFADEQDFNEEAALGQQGGSLRIGQYDVDLRSSVIGRALAMGATIAALEGGEILDAEDQPSWQAAAGRSLKGVADNPLAQGTNVLDQLIDKPIEGLARYAVQQAGGALTPAFVRELSRVGAAQNPVVERQAGAGRELTDRWKQGIPGMRGTLPGRTDVFGFKDSRTYWQNLFGLRANKDNPVAKELARLKVPITQPGQSKKNDRKYGDERLGIKDGRFDRGTVDHAERVAFLGMRVWQELSQIFQDPTYPNMPDGEKRQWVKNLVSQIREQAGMELDDMRLRLGRDETTRQVRQLLAEHQAR